MDTKAPRLCEIAYDLGPRRYPVDNPSDIAPLIDEARNLLAQGADPNTPNHAGETPLGIFASSFRGSNNKDLLVFSELLLAHGANPMLADKPLGTAISHSYSSLLTTSTLLAIARAETNGTGLRDEHGGNSLHYLASVDPQLASWQLEEDIYTIAEGDIDPLFFPAVMINARRASDGSTPLDVLWRTGAKPWLDAPQDQAWRMTDALLKLGADPFMPDDRGLCVVHEINQMTLAGIVSPPTDVWGKVHAKWSQQQLSSNTTPAAASRSSAHRL